MIEIVRKDEGWKKGCSWTNAPLSVADALPGQPYSSRTMADIRNHSGRCSPWWSPLGLTGLLSKTQPLKPSAFHHCTEMTTQTCYFVGWRDNPWHCHCTAMRCQWKHQNLSLMGKNDIYGSVRGLREWGTYASTYPISLRPSRDFDSRTCSRQSS